MSFLQWASTAPHLTSRARAAFEDVWNELVRGGCKNPSRLLTDLVESLPRPVDFDEDDLL